MRWLATLLVSATIASLPGSGAPGPRPSGVRPTQEVGRQVELNAQDGVAGDGFGSAVAISGRVAIAGAPYHAVGSRSAQGSAYVFTRSGSSWNDSTPLTAADGSAGDEFGSGVALEGDLAIVGSPHHQVGSNRLQGAAYVFTGARSSWTQTAELVAPDGSVSDEFGAAIAVSGSLAVVGAPYHSVGTNIEQGAAYVFERQGSSWIETGELTAADGMAYDNLGIAVAVSGGTIVVGSDSHQVGANIEQGTAYVFARKGPAWIQSGELVASDGGAEDFFGSAVAVSDATVVVGAPDHRDGPRPPEGETYVFTRKGLVWTQSARLLATPRGARRTSFGDAVAVSDGTLVVGGEGHQVGDHREQGVAYVFTGGGSSWTAAGQLVAADGGAYDELGAAVALSGHAAALGAPGHRPGRQARQGAAYVFERMP